MENVTLGSILSVLKNKKQKLTCVGLLAFRLKYAWKEHCSHSNKERSK